MNYIESIELGLKEKKSHCEIVRKIFLTFPTKVFIENEERKFEIFNEVGFHFQVPITSIHVVGSAKTGQSFHKSSSFSNENSDLDIAIIDPGLFLRYTEFVFKLTDGFLDRTHFPLKGGKSTFESYRYYVSRGIFRPDLMPMGKKRANWNKFFGKLSSKNKDLFKSINAGIYMSEVFFEEKQTSVIRNYLDKKAV